ncbi:MAG: prephenate dehydrogenase/arogenate dehydrogenase family protein [Chthoniobacterales bacterium]
MSFKRVSIFGAGLIGGSLALALQSSGIASQVAVWARRKETVDALKKLGFSHASQSLEEIAADAEIAIICTPVVSILEIGEQLSKMLPPSSFVTDAGSTKHTIVEKLGGIFGARFVGSHPMAGSEQSGLAAARADLFQDALSLITPCEKTSPDAVRAIESLWQAVGCRIAKLDAAAHDCLMARISHTPHVTASALVNLVCASDATAQNYAGGGYRDTTRVASGSPNLWQEILLDNSEEVSSAIQALIAQLEDVKTALDRRDVKALHAFLTKAKTARDSYVGKQDAYDV